MPAWPGDRRLCAGAANKAERLWKRIVSNTNYGTKGKTHAHCIRIPGQGSQSVGMLSGFADNAVVADYMARANAALGEDLVKLIAEGPAEVLSLTVNTQPALLAASAAFYEA